MSQWTRLVRMETVNSIPPQLGSNLVQDVDDQIPSKSEGETNQAALIDIPNVSTANPTTVTIKTISTTADKIFDSDLARSIDDVISGNCHQPIFGQGDVIQAVK